MALKPEYKIVSGEKEIIGERLAALASEGWKPVMMSAVASSGGQLIVVVMFERQPPQPA
jgi:hypothetical protein